MNTPDQPIRIAFVTDFPQERWESMDYVAEMLQLQFRENRDLKITLVPVTPRYIRMFGRISNTKICWNLDRFINRRLVLPVGLWMRLRREKQPFDASLLVDHSYAHIVPLLKRMKCPTLVICHDTDAISAIMPENRAKFGFLHRRFARAIFNGLAAADIITTVTNHVKMQLVNEYHLDAAKINVVENGIATEFHSRKNINDKIIHRKVRGRWPVLVHVGSVIPRKRIDLLIEIVYLLKKTYPDIICLRIGGAFAPEHEARLKYYGVEDSFQVMPRLSRDELAAVYRQASIVLITSDAEGFGLPLVEALACGAAVLASDLPVLREVGGDLCMYAVPGNAFSFEAESIRILEFDHDPLMSSRRLRRTQQNKHLQKYQWPVTAQKLAALLHQLKSETNEIDPS